MTTYNLPDVSTSRPADSWHVLVLYTDDTERDIKGLWGPYTSFELAAEAQAELSQWPLDGYWDIRRLNRFVAMKSGTQPNGLARVFTWNYEHA